jgi:4-alpha-glucanotransferase
VREERAGDRVHLHAALVDAGSGTLVTGGPAASFDLGLAGAVHTYLADSAAALVALQLEDLLGMSEPVNVPGTLDEYPNWQRKLDADLDTLLGDEAVQRLLARVDTGRGKSGSEPD